MRGIVPVWISMRVFLDLPSSLCVCSWQTIGPASTTSDVVLFQRCLQNSQLFLFVFGLCKYNWIKGILCTFIWIHTSGFFLQGTKNFSASLSRTCSGRELTEFCHRRPYIFGSSIETPFLDFHSQSRVFCWPRFKPLSFCDIFNWGSVYRCFTTNT